MEKFRREKVYDWLREVMDPEIPVLSLVDLGVIAEVEVSGDTIKIIMMPTFVGCPALELMQTEIRDTLAAKGVDHVDIEISYKKPWTSDMISAAGKEALKKFGLAPPASRQLFSDVDFFEHAVCPRCGNNNTDLKNIFGATLCRSIHYCNDCKEAFEQFKAI